MTQKLYAQDGVNVEEGDDFSAFAAEAIKLTHGNSHYVEVQDFSNGHFRGPRGFRFVDPPPNCFYDFAPDGIGTKVGLITEALTHENAARDLLSMTAGDITRWGGLPIMFTNVLDVSSIGENGDETNECLRDLIRGLVDAAHEIGVVVYKGETAELGPYVGSENPDAVTKFNWSGFAMGIYDRDRIITGDTLAAGQHVVALRENGFRSNGISSVRKALACKFGDTWWNNPEAAEAIKQAAEQSILYDKFLADANGWNNPGFNSDFNIHLIAHITGGGIKSKFVEDILFPRGLSAYLDDLWEPPQIMKDCAEWRGMDDEQCYETWNGGQGALVVIDSKDTEPFIARAKEFDIEAKVCGTIIKSSEVHVSIRSKFTGKTIQYNA